MERDLEFMGALLQAKSPSSVENEAIKVWDDFMAKLEGFSHAYSDNIKNSGWTIGHGPTKILLSGHLDEIALAVVNVDSSGYITLASMAGPDKKCLPGSKLLILTEKNTWVPGIIQKAPIHIEHSENTIDKVSGYSDIRLDIGVESKEEAEELGVFTGCPVVFDRNIILEHGKNKVVGNALDDKAAVYVISQVAKSIANLPQDHELFEKYTIYFLAGTQEESGLRGLSVAAHNINPDISIDLDVTFACDGGLVSGKNSGEVYLGKGPVIEFGQDKNREIAIELMKIASYNKIDFQRGFAKCGGTNTDVIQLYSKDCKTMLVSIPNMSMHTPNETCDWRDLSGAIKLLTEYLTGLK